MANPDWIQDVLGCLMLLFGGIWVWIEMRMLADKILTFLGRRVGGGRGNPAESQNVEQALAAMYDSEGAKYRKSEHGLRKNGGHNA